MVRRIVSTVLLCLVSTAVRADVIDGDWCAPDGRSLTIDGTSVRVPSGETVIGEYARHVYRYIGPNGSDEEAHDVRMYLYGEDDLRVDRIIDGVPMPQEKWRRCKPIV